MSLPEYQAAYTAKDAIGHDNPDVTRLPFVMGTDPARADWQRLIDAVTPPDYTHVFNLLYGKLCEIAQLLAGQHIPNLEYVEAFGSNFQPVAIKDTGRRYNLIWAPATIALIIDGPQGSATYNLAAGWNAMHLSPGTRISSTAAPGPTYLTLRYTDDPAGGLF